MRFWFRKHDNPDPPTAIIGVDDKTIAVVYGDTGYDAVARAQVMCTALNDREARVLKTYNEMKAKQEKING